MPWMAFRYHHGTKASGRPICGPGIGIPHHIPTQAHQVLGVEHPPLTVLPYAPDAPASGCGYVGSVESEWPSDGSPSLG
jgi:hypothetical protein